MRDPVELEIFKNLYHSIAEEMGAALRRTAFSPNIKERRDYSCAVFDGDGEVIAMGDHMPVHLGSMPMSVQAAIGSCEMHPGDIVMLNDPFRGGTHLPDITLVAPVHVWGGHSCPPKARNHPDFYVASRAHHADVGGAYAGSMGLCREIYQEGFRIPPVKIMRAGMMDRDVLALLLNNVRTPEEREGDLGAQIAACHTGAGRLREICQRYGSEKVKRAARELLDYSEELMRAFLQKVPTGTHRAEDLLDNDGITDKPVKIAVTVKVSPKRTSVRVSDPRKGRRGSVPTKPVVIVDFTGSDPQVEGSINAVEAITYSACFYVFRCLLADDIPATAGLMRPIQVIAPPGTIVNARPPAAVAGGNVETSQRIVDTLLRALARAIPHRIPAASQGTMNNLTLGGMDPRRENALFTYYETIAGGAGAGPGSPGRSATHTHMTNSLNTPTEVLEHAYPVRVRRYAIRRDSGGRGKFSGGEGILREIEFLTHVQVGVLSDRRKNRPYGLSGGSGGAVGKNTLIFNRQAQQIPSKSSFFAPSGAILRVETPGGGGWGLPLRKRKELRPEKNTSRDVRREIS